MSHVFVAQIKNLNIVVERYSKNRKIKTKIEKNNNT